ncbi:DUF5681 domain-containing protein [Pseudaminobacter sp. NGMCC 1.201702]|uniref:DUF5681 domain-containing protein n=1 Tax=Pseudaminobacter sp. NGMCC 1.201702 TaxID=3391825 RepID=UPI0039EF32FF
MNTRIKGRFAPGQSGNPSGRPKTPEHVKAMLDGLTEKAVQALGEALDGDDLKLKLMAAQEVLNRSLGKPHATASLDVNHKSDGPAHLLALAALARNAVTLPKPGDMITIDPEPHPAPLVLQRPLEPE